MAEQQTQQTEQQPKPKNKAIPKDAQLPPGDIRRKTRRERRSGPFVKYVGAAAVRTINPTQWHTLAVPLKSDTATHTWSFENDKMIEAAHFSDEQLDYLLVDDLQPGRNTHSFLLMDYDEDGQLVQVEYE